MNAGSHWYEIKGWIRLERPIHYVARVISIGLDVRDVESVIDAECENMKEDWPNIKEFSWEKVR